MSVTSLRNGFDVNFRTRWGKVRRFTFLSWGVHRSFLQVKYTTKNGAVASISNLGARCTVRRQGFTSFYMFHFHFSFPPLVSVSAVGIEVS